jgi:scyllo-inositol 2-dehydrogenase (NADP+)
MPGSTAPLRVAVVGFGQAGQTFHAPLVAAAPELELSAITTSDPSRASLATSRYPGVQVCPGTDDLYARVPGLNLVVIATPNDVHAVEAMRAMERGIAVVIDKPFALSVPEGERLLAAAAAHGTLLTVFQNRRWDSDHLTLRRLLNQNRLGDVWRYEARYEFARPGPAPHRTNGLLLGLGSHLVDQALQLFGPAKTVYGEVATRIGDQDDDTFLAITHDGGVRSHIWLSSRVPVPGPRLRVIGSAGQFQIEHHDGQEALLRASHRLPPPGRPTEPASNWGMLTADGASQVVPAEPGQWTSFYPGVAAAIRGQGTVPVEGASALYALKVMEAARTSSATGAVVSV